MADGAPRRVQVSPPDITPDMIGLTQLHRRHPGPTPGQSLTTIQAAAVVFLTAGNTITMVHLFAVLFGIGFGGRNPLTTAIKRDYFGRTSFGKFLGISTMPMNFLLLIAPSLAGYMRDVQGTYTMALELLAALSFFGGSFFLMALRPEMSSAS